MKILAYLSFLLFTSSVNAQVYSKGSMSEMSQQNFNPAIQLDSLLTKPHLFGLGPYGRMQGEITVIDSKPFTAIAPNAHTLNVKQIKKAKAPFFAYSYVENWDSFEVSAVINNTNDIEALIKAQAQLHGYSTSKPFPFRVKGTFDKMTIHVVTPRTSDVKGYQKGINSHKFELENRSGEIFGFYANDAHGVYTPANSNIHIHFINNTRNEMGHIDAVSFSGVSTLTIQLPAQNKGVDQSITFETIDTDFSKGRLSHQQNIRIDDLEKFHGHLCDGLVVGALAMQAAMKELYPNQPIDRTNLRIVSKPSPCLTDVAIYLTGGRYQFNTFYVDNSFDGLYIIQRIDNLKTVSVSLNKGVKPIAIDSLGDIAIQQKLSPCDIDHLRQLEDDFTHTLLQSDPTRLFTVKDIQQFKWNPNTKNDYLKTDIINKNLPTCQ